MDRISTPAAGSRRNTRSRTPQQGNWKSPLVLVTAVGAALLVLVAGSAFAYQSAYAGQVFPGVKVGDVSVGGMTKDAAAAKLRPWLGERASETMTLKAPDFLRKVTASDLGATYDTAAAVDAAYSVGRSGSVLEQAVTQVSASLSGHPVEAPGLRIDRAKLASAIAGWAREIDRPVKDATIKLNDVSVTVTPSVIGRKLDQAAAAVALEKALGSDTASMELPVAETEPKVSDKDVEDARARLSKMLSGPVSIEFDSQKWTVSVKEIAAATSVDQKPGTPVPVVTFKSDSVKKLVDKIGGEIDQPKSNARFDWNGGKPKLLRAGQDGRTLDREAAVSAITTAVSGDSKSVKLPVVVDRAAGSGVDPSKLGLTDQIETASTSFAGSVPEKAHNIRLAASRLNGVLLAPGDVFSFNKELGPTTLKSGFQIGFGIAVSNGEMQTVPSVAGGICQVASTLLHTFFNAGYQLEERYPHAYWIQSYGLPPKGMVGLDATVDDPNLDLKFKNNSDNYLLVQAGTDGTTVTFSLYGTKPNWKVEIDKPVITNVVKADPEPVRQEEPTWSVGRELWVERATDGMDVVITRRVIQNGETRTLNLKSHYEPSKNVLMVGSAPVPGATPEATPGGTPGPTQTASSTPAPGAAPTGSPAAAPTAAPSTQPKPGPTAAPAKPTATSGTPKPAATAVPQPPTPTAKKP